MIRGPKNLPMSYKSTFYKMLYIFIPFSAIVFGLSFILKSGAFSRKFVLLFLGLYFLFIIIQYFLFNILIKNKIIHLPLKKILIIGAGRVGEKLYNELMNEWASNINIIGFLDDDENICLNFRELILGPISKYKSILKTKNVNEVYITIPLINENKIKDMIITPHLGEFAAMSGFNISHIKANIINIAREFVLKHPCTLVLKGAPTIVVSPDGEVGVNSSGNPGLATGGTGDILTGLIAGLRAQNMSSFDAAICAVFIHGLAGDLGRNDFGIRGLIASDLLNYIPGILREFEEVQ